MTTKRFFCLRGFMKSGTNWLGSLLSSHADISVVGEFHWQELVTSFNQNLANLPVYQSEEQKNLARDDFEEMMRKCVLRKAEPNATVIGERTPHSIIPVTFRNVPYISIIRDGRDVLVSRAFHLYNQASVHKLFDRIPEMAKTLEHFKSDPWFFKKHPDQLLCHEIMVRESVTWWREHLRLDRQAVETLPKLKIRFIKYEDLHVDTQGEREKLFHFLDVDPSRASKIKGHLKPGFKKEQPSEFFRKGVVGDWKNYFTDATKDWFKDEGAEELVEYGYEDSTNW